MMFTRCNYKLEDPTTTNTLSDDFKLTHYLVPIVDPTITKAANLMSFTQNSDGKTGYMTEYPIIKFIYAHGTTFKIPADQSRQGGRLTIKLPSTLKFSSDPVKNDLITYSADQVAFYKTVYDTSKNYI